MTYKEYCSVLAGYRNIIAIDTYVRTYWREWYRDCKNNDGAKYSMFDSIVLEEIEGVGENV